MKIKFFNIIIVAIIASTPIYFSCSNQQNAHDHSNETAVDEHEGLDHGVEESEDNHSSEADEHKHGTTSYTVFQNGYELFMEMSTMIVRESASMTIHITRLSDYKPIQAEEIKVSLNGEKTYNTNAHGHLTGIYHAAFKPKQTGSYQLNIDFNDLNKNLQFTVDSITVYLNHDQLPNTPEEEAGLIPYLKEQVWTEDFGIYKVQSQAFSRVIKTSGEILPAPGDETIITALHSGTVSLRNLLIEGKKVSQGDVIGIISSDLIHQNLTNDYLEAKNKFTKANMDYERAKNLIDEKLISEREYSETKLNYKSTKNAFNNIAKFYSDGNENVKASMNGFIRSVFVREGQFINEGQPIATIIQNKKIILKADIPQQYNHLASGIYAANFSPVYTNKLFSTNDLNGERLSYSSALPANSLFTSVNFELDASNEIMPGSYCQVFLKSAATKNTLITPVSALMEDQGNYFVFIMANGEHYKKTYITIGDSDGEFVEVLSGIAEGDYVVNKGTYKVYLASLGTAAPTQSHAH
ncbi:MAG: efflux RND transporter periplasmic adaptor subunit [Salinivirgaceae bacterium]|jgi:cobalt-zinc-cadmium efflux system membrane fusion protein|nr:efflux RND transporter periplasmic adaptor subunit [Salinivirgaceae bacterium]